MLDDVLVNFDTERAKAAAAVLRDFAAAGHQLLIFTCHEHILKLFQSLRAPVSRLPSNAGPGEVVISRERRSEEKPDRRQDARPLRRKTAAKERRPRDADRRPADEAVDDEEEELDESDEEEEDEADQKTRMNRFGKKTTTVRKSGTSTTTMARRRHESPLRLAASPARRPVFRVLIAAVPAAAKRVVFPSRQIIRSPCQPLPAPQ